MESSKANHASHAITPVEIALVVWRRLPVIILIIAVSLTTAWFVSTRTPKRWKSSAQLLLVQRAAIVVSRNDGTGPTPTIEPIETQQAMLQSFGMSKRTIDWMKNDAIAHGRSTDDITMSAEELQKSITVAVPNGTNLVDISVEANDRNRAIDYVNAVCQAFIHWKKEMAAQSAREALDSLQTRVNRARANMESAEREELAFRQKYQLVDVEAQQTAALQKYNADESATTSIQMDIAAQKARIKDLATRLEAANRTLRSATSLRDDGLMSELQAQLNTLETQRAELAVRYTASHPELVTVDKKIANIKSRLKSAVQATARDRTPSFEQRDQLQQEYRNAQMDLARMQAHLAAATAEGATAKQKLADKPRLSTMHDHLMRKVDMNRNIFSSLESSLSALKLNQDMANGNVEISQYGYASDTPVRPIRSRDMGFGGAVGAFLALVAVLFLEQSDRRVRNLGSVRSLVPGPVIGIMPRLSRREIDGLITGESCQIAHEAFSLARANMSLAIRRSTQRDLWDKQVILITSAVPGEGKSVTAAGLAKSIARSGRNVVLVDADMRRPTQNALFGTDEQTGLADVLEGTMRLEDAIVATDIETLGVLHSGRAHSSPTELMSHPRMAETISQLRGEADVIIVDSPACSVVADALLLAPHSDCVLQVVGAGQADREIVRATTDALMASEPQSMLYFVNRVSRERTSASHSYYYADPSMGALSPVKANADRTMGEIE